MSSLYEIKGEFITLMYMLEELEAAEREFENAEKNKSLSDAEVAAIRKELEEQRQLVTDTLEGIKGELEIKAEGYIAVHNEFKAQAQIFKQEKQKWEAKQKTAENAMKRLDAALFDALVATGHDDKDGLDTGYHTLKIVNNGGLQPLKIDIPAEELPPIFRKVTITADTEKIRGMLSKGEDVAKEYPWAHLEPRGRRLSIK